VSKKAVVSWGRFNPPTIGHEKLVIKLASLAKRERGDPRVYLSHTQHPKKDPLSYREKIRFARAAFGSIVKPSTSRTIIELMKELQRDGYKQVTIVAGSDRVDEYTTLLNKYNDKEYSFDQIKVVSAGERDPDAPGAEGMSATKLRQAAVSGDEKLFHTGAPTNLSKAQKTKLYKLVRKGMLVEEIDLYTEALKKEKDIDDEDFSDEDLADAIDEIDDEEDDEDDIDEETLSERSPLTLQQRIKRGRLMKRLAPKMKRLRKIRKFRMAPLERLQVRARKVARNLLRKRFAGEKGAKYASLPPSQKITVDNLIANKAAVIERLAKRLLPLMRKKEVERIRQARKPKEEHFEKIFQDVTNLFEKSVPQDADIADRKGTQPAKYHAGLTKSTKVIRDAQFKKQAKMASDDPRAYKPAPGDATAQTKPSKYTKMYKNMFGESEAQRSAKELIKKEKERDKIRHDAMLDRARLQDVRAANKNEEYELTEKSMEALQAKASKSGYSYGTLKKVYDRGVAAWRTGHRPGTTPQQWGYARVNAFIAKQKSGQKLNHDQDLTNSV
jgi:nicotinic acid mononucleotide adenylyltransferase